MVQVGSLKVAKLVRAPLEMFNVSESDSAAARGDVTAECRSMLTTTGGFVMMVMRPD